MRRRSRFITMNTIATQTTLHTTVASPIGELLLVGDHNRLLGLYVGRAAGDAACERDDNAFAEARDQLDQYFAGARTRFELELEREGTNFQRRVWGELEQIPYGETITYAELSRRIGARSARAVGAANARNPISIIVPCHRVIGADGTLTGYSGGIDRKRQLLTHERALATSATKRAPAEAEALPKSDTAGLTSPRRSPRAGPCRSPLTRR